MSKSTPKILRRSPRFHSQNKNLIPFTPKTEPNPSKKPFLAKTVSNLTQSSNLEKTLKGCLVKCSKDTPLRSVENLNWSLKKKVEFDCVNELVIGKGNVSGGGLRGEKCKSFDGGVICKTKSRRSFRLMGKENVSCGGLDGEKCKREGAGRKNEKRGSVRYLGKESLSNDEVKGEKSEKGGVGCKLEKRRPTRLMGKGNVSSEDFNFLEKEGVGCVKVKRRSVRLIGKQNVAGEGLSGVKCTSFEKEGVECKKKKRHSIRLKGNENVRNNAVNEENLKFLEKERGECRKEKRFSPRLMNLTEEEEYKENVSADESNEENDNDNLDFIELGKKNAIDELGDNLKVNEGEEEAKKKRKREEFCQEEIASDKVDKAKCSIFGEWSEEQDLALRKAYFVSKPSPHFWKKVSKMVPGKSAQECFDRVNGSLDTPPQQQPRSRAKKISCMSPIGNFNLPGSTPIIHPIPIAKKLSSRKKSLVAQKTVRHLLRKHSTNDQNQEADHFSAFETSPLQFAIDSPETGSAIVSPQGFSSSHKKTLSRFSKVNEPSPEVLKRIKNMALHEKYIDQLHNREARRKYDASRGRVVKMEGENRSGVVKAAKSALISEANEVISLFRDVQVNLQENANDDNDYYDVEEDDIDDE